MRRCTRCSMENSVYVIEGFQALHFYVDLPCVLEVRLCLCMLPEWYSYLVQNDRWHL
jgi:hypothetical protein